MELTCLTTKKIKSIQKVYKSTFDFKSFQQTVQIIPVDKSGYLSKFATACMRLTNNSQSSMYSAPSATVKIEPNSAGPSPDKHDARMPRDPPAPPASSTGHPASHVDFAAVIANAERLSSYQSASLASVPKSIANHNKKDSDSAASGVGKPSSAFTSAAKRRESHDFSEARSSKIPCNHSAQGGGYDMTDDTIQNVTNAIDRERRKHKEEMDRQLEFHQEQLRKKDEERAAAVQELEAKLQEEARQAEKVVKHVRDLEKSQATELEKRTLAFAQDTKTQRTEIETAWRAKVHQLKLEHDSEKKQLEIRIAKLQAELDTANRYQRETFTAFERQIKQRQDEYYNESVRNLTSAYEKRGELILLQCQAEARSSLAEQKTKYETQIVALKTELAGLQRDTDLRRDVRKVTETLEPFMQSVFNATSQLEAIKSKSNEIFGNAREINDHACQLRGFMQGLQRPQPVMQPPVMYYPPPQQHMPVPVRARHGGFHPESAPAPP